MSWIVNLSLVLLTQMAAGWVVARTHRLYQIPMVFAYLISCLLWFFGPQLFWVRTMLVEWDQVDPKVHPYLAYFLLTILLTVLGILIGSILARPTRQRSSVGSRAT